MAIRLPLQNILTVTANDSGASSVAGGIPFLFQIPMDTDNVVVKMTASISGGVSAIFQTTDDGGTTWYDVARTSVVSNAVNANAQWLSVPVISAGINPAVQTGQLSSTVGATIGSSAASTLGQRQVSGLPLLSMLNRIFLVYSGTITANSLVTVNVKVNSQSATA